MGAGNCHELRMHCAWSLWVKTVQVDGHTPFLCTVTAGLALRSGGRCHGCMSNGSWPWYLFRYEHGNTDEAGREAQMAERQ